MTLCRRLLRILTLGCEEATVLASQAMDEPLHAPERLALYGHLLVCVPCARFRKQLRMLRDSVRGSAGVADTLATDPGLSPEAKLRITTALVDGFQERGES
jgi:hypothetical protein